MKNEIFNQEPNSIGEAYRNNFNLQIPRRIERHYDFLEFSEDGLLLLGTSNLNGRIWSGSVWVFEGLPESEPEIKPDIEKCVAGIEFESTVTSGLWLDKNKKIVIGCDSGSLHQLSLNSVANKDENKNYFTTDGIVTEHDDSVVSLDLMKDKTKVVSGGMDMNIKVWDVATLVSERSYCPAHGHIVTSLSALADNSEVFASTSLDGTSLLWDTREDKPASLLLKNKCGYTACCWIDEKCISLGSNDGSVSLVDIRMKYEFDRNLTSQRPIFKLKYNKKLDLLAVCADDPTVRVFNCVKKNLTDLYESDQHKDFVRGLAWEPSSNILYTCGWDSKIIIHKIVTSEAKD